MGFFNQQQSLFIGWNLYSYKTCQKTLHVCFCLIAQYFYNLLTLGIAGAFAIKRDNPISVDIKSQVLNIKWLTVNIIVRRIATEAKGQRLRIENGFCLCKKM